MIRICIYLKCRIRIRKTDSAFCLQDLGDFVSCIMHATPFSTSNPPVSPLVYPCSGNVLLVQNIPQVLIKGTVSRDTFREAEPEPVDPILFFGVGRTIVTKI